MSCRSCGGTMRTIDHSPAKSIRWCVRCGSLATEWHWPNQEPQVKSEAPELVEQARRLLHALDFEELSDDADRDITAVSESVGSFACGRMGI